MLRRTGQKGDDAVHHPLKLSAGQDDGPLFVLRWNSDSAIDEIQRLRPHTVQRCPAQTCRVDQRTVGQCRPPKQIGRAHV